MAARTTARLSATPRCAARAPGRRALHVRAASTLPTEYKTLTPVGDRVFIKCAPAEQVTAGGIVLALSAAKRPTCGEVVGVDVKGGSALSSGATVVYSANAGTEFEIEKDTYLLLKEADCIGEFPEGPLSDIKELKPLGDRVVLELAAADDVSAGGLVFAGSNSDEPMLMGRVHAAGPDVEGCAAGDDVIYEQYRGADFQSADGARFLVLKEADIIAGLS